MRNLFVYFLIMIISTSVVFAQDILCPPVSAMLVIDRSDTMSQGTNLADAKAAASAFVNAMNFPADEAGLTSFNFFVTLDQALTSNPVLVTNSINALVAGGQTNIGGGINVGAAELLANGGPVKAMILLSDGTPNVDSVGGICVGAFAIGNPCGVYSLSEAATAKAAGIEIFTIGLGVAGGSDSEALMQQIATDNAHYFSAATSQDLENIYLLIAGEVVCPECGNEIVEPPEECDDGNLVDGDGCSANCTDEPVNEIPEFTTIGAGLALAGVG